MTFDDGTLLGVATAPSGSGVAHVRYRTLGG